MELCVSQWRSYGGSSYSVTGPATFRGLKSHGRGDIKERLANQTKLTLLNSYVARPNPAVNLAPQSMLP